MYSKEKEKPACTPVMRQEAEQWVVQTVGGNKQKLMEGKGGESVLFFQTTLPFEI